MDIKNMSIKDLAQEIYDEKRDYNEVKALIGEEKAKELVKEISAIDGVPFIDVDSPEGLKLLEAIFNN
jgi:spore coat protein CotH